MKEILQKKFFPMLLSALVIGGIVLAGAPVSYAHGGHGHGGGYGCGNGGGHGHGGGYCDNDCPYYNGR